MQVKPRSALRIEGKMWRGSRVLRLEFSVPHGEPLHFFVFTCDVEQLLAGNRNTVNIFFDFETAVDTHR